jgi:single-strand DNA-binding protein
MTKNNRDHLSKAELVGRLGADPELQHTSDGTPYVRMSVATSERYTDRGGAIKDRTDWHSAVAWGEKAEAIASEFKKGQAVAIEGTMVVNAYEKDGVKHRTTELRVDDMRAARDQEQSRNDARLIGVLREDARVQTVEGRRALTTLSVATSLSVAGKDGQNRTRADWHSVTLWGSVGEKARDLKAGDIVSINGSLRHRTVQDKESGKSRHLSALDGAKFQLLERNQEFGKNGPNQAPAAEPPKGRAGDDEGTAPPAGRGRRRGRSGPEIGS